MKSGALFLGRKVRSEA